MSIFHKTLGVLFAVLGALIALDLMAINKTATVLLYFAIAITYLFDSRLGGDSDD